ncbi:ATP-dependent sacrificial sulfur transferase LarE, partial [Deltaproteobacteria bacterium OttesenSCG-928-M10]|nr:ATP-dependent sacrificial sulfur transferase LarE [Deltaproteobacteria bacterium OttesenSCG-928-M10]
MPVDITQKYRKLKRKLKSLGRVALAFSGGTDSTLLLKACAEALEPGDILALTARAAIFPAWETREAEDLAALYGLRHLVADFDALAVPAVAANPPDRCYHCKYNLFQKLIFLAGEEGFTTLIDGANLDDQNDYRPGSRAAAELGVVSPLRAAGLTKADVRELSRKKDLPTWDKPAFACLASRFPYGQAITREKLAMVEQAEQYLIDLGFREIRVRHHGEVARLEVGRGERRRFFDDDFIDEVHRHLKAMGFAFVALDLAG